MTNEEALRLAKSWRGTYFNDDETADAFDVLAKMAAENESLQRTLDKQSQAAALAIEAISGELEQERKDYKSKCVGLEFAQAELSALRRSHESH